MSCCWWKKKFSKKKARNKQATRKMPNWVLWDLSSVNSTRRLTRTGPLARRISQQNLRRIPPIISL